MPEKSACNSSPRIVFVNYADDQYKFQQRFALMAARKFGGFSEVIPYSPAGIDDSFRKENSRLLSIPRGNGLWIWKPYVILDALEKVSEGDYVFYCDSGAFVFGSIMPLIESMGDCDIWVSSTENVEEQWTKPQVFTWLGITDAVIKSSQQIQASFICARKSEMSCSFVREWLRLCTVPEPITPLQPGEQRGECIEHREDQSLLSLLCKLRGIKPHKPPVLARLNLRARVRNKIRKKLGLPVKWQEAKHVPFVSDDTYKPCIYHHRIRKADSILSMIWQTVKGLRMNVAAKALSLITAGTRDIIAPEISQER